MLAGERVERAFRAARHGEPRPNRLPQDPGAGHASRRWGHRSASFSWSTAEKCAAGTCCSGTLGVPGGAVGIAGDPSRDERAARRRGQSNLPGDR